MSTRSTLMLAIALAACAPNGAPVAVRGPALPAVFDGSAAGDSAASIDWQAFFDDAALRDLIAEALSTSPDVQIALQRIELARAGVRRTSGALLPEVTLATGAALRRYGRFTMDGAGNATTDITPGRIVPNPLGDLVGRVQAVWEADLWRRLRDLRGAARESYLASIEATHLIVSSLVSEIAVTFYELLAVDHIRDLLDQTMVRQAQALDMMRLQKEAGQTNELAVQQFEAQLADTRALAAGVVQRGRELENQLNVLVGRIPQQVARDKAALTRTVPTSLASGVPSALLRNRPDIREAEHQVRAARLDVAAARAAFYPRVVISADLGYQAFNPRYLLRTPESLVYSLVGGLVAPLVNRRALEADFAAARASQIEAMYRYQGIVLRAFAEVATGLSAQQQAAAVVAERERRRQAVVSTIEMADALFRAGQATYLEVLVAQQNALEADLELIEALRDQHIARVRLYTALGGGWKGAVTLRP